MGKFTGVWGVFENLDEMTDTIKDVRGKDVRPTTLSAGLDTKSNMLWVHNSHLCHGSPLHLEHLAVLLVMVSLRGRLLIGFFPSVENRS